MRYLISHILFYTPNFLRFNLLELNKIHLIIPRFWNDANPTPHIWLWNTFACRGVHGWLKDCKVPMFRGCKANLHPSTAAVNSWCFCWHAVCFFTNCVAVRYSHTSPLRSRLSVGCCSRSPEFLRPWHGLTWGAGSCWDVHSWGEWQLYWTFTHSWKSSSL